MIHLKKKKKKNYKIRSKLVNTSKIWGKKKKKKEKKKKKTRLNLGMRVKSDSERLGINPVFVFFFFFFFLHNIQCLNDSVQPLVFPITHLFVPYSHLSHS